VGVPLVWQTVVQEEVVAGVAMTGQLPPGLEGRIVSGALPPERGPGGGALEAP
jgi:hypothetical protein